MPDRIDKFSFNDQVYRVDARRDAMEEQQKDTGQEGGDEEKEKDHFDKLSEKTDWHVLFDKQNLWNRNIEIHADEIQSIEFLGLNLRTDPSLLNISVHMTDGTVIPTAFLAIARSMGLKFKNLQKHTSLAIGDITRDENVRVTIPIDEDEMGEEITRLTKEPKEKSLTQKLRRLNKTWIQKLGIQDPVSKRINNEILGIYFTVLAVLSVVIFGILYLLLE
jgi:hypothetical protein